MPVEVIAQGLSYGGWKSARVTRAIDTLADAFSFSVSDRWAGGIVGQQIIEGDEIVFPPDFRV